MLRDLEFVPISEGDYNTLLGMNGGCPESPDGKLLVYARKKFIDNPEYNKTEIWICQTDLTCHRKVFEVTCGNHNGPSASFINNKTIVFRSVKNHLNAFYILNVETGKLSYGPIYAKESHCAENGIYPFSISKDYIGRNPEYPQIRGIGIYTLNTRSGEIRKIVSSEEMYDFIKQRGLTPSSMDGSLSHVQLSPSCTRVMMRFSVDECKIFGALGCYDIATGAKFIIPDKPVHQLWFDDNTYMAVHQHYDGKRIEMETSRINRYTPDGKLVETLGGIGNHMDGSPDRQWFASDTAYPGEDIRVLLFRRGKVEPTAILAQHRFLKATWDYHVHPNPSFSADGRKVYFNRAINDTRIQAGYVDISSILL